MDAGFDTLVEQKMAEHGIGRLPASHLAFDEAYPGLRRFLGEAGSWSRFADNLTIFLGNNGRLTPKQLAAALSMRTKCEARAAARAAERKEKRARRQPHWLREFNRAY